MSKGALKPSAYMKAYRAAQQAQAVSHVNSEKMLQINDFTKMQAELIKRPQSQNRYLRSSNSNLAATMIEAINQHSLNELTNNINRSRVASAHGMTQKIADSVKIQQEEVTNEKANTRYGAGNKA